ncbi:MAG TPA: hypothetical protein VG122_25740 [Gemmata sp.]|jgi:hypothetical protein|nr:hypothetical protein [Gemmata sp.]
MVRILSCLLSTLTVFVVGCSKESKPTASENKQDEHAHGHNHEQNKMMIEDFGSYHAGLTAHLSKKEGNELDIVFETQDKEPKPVPLPLTKLIAKATRSGDDKTHTLEFEPAEKNERKDDSDGKCSRFTAKAPWIKHEDMLTVTLITTLDGKEKRVVWVDFNPKKFAHIDE